MFFVCLHLVYVYVYLLVLLNGIQTSSFLSRPSSHIPLLVVVRPVFARPGLSSPEMSCDTVVLTADALVADKMSSMFLFLSCKGSSI